MTQVLFTVHDSSKVLFTVLVPGKSLLTLPLLEADGKNSEGTDTRSVSVICLRRTVQTSCSQTHLSKVYWLPHNAAKTDWLPSLVTSGLSFTSVQMTITDWLADAVRSFGMQHAVFGTDRLKPMLWAVSSVRLLSVSLFFIPCVSIAYTWSIWCWAWMVLSCTVSLDGPQLYSRRGSCMRTFSQVNHVGRS